MNDIVCCSIVSYVSVHMFMLKEDIVITMKQKITNHDEVHLIK